MELPADILNPSCPSRTVLRHVTDRWAPMIIMVLNEQGKLRFTEIRRLVGGISGKVLTETLRSMERDGLVNREVIASVPPQVNYTITALGKSVSCPLTALREWAESHVAEVLQNRQQFDMETSEQ